MWGRKKGVYRAWKRKAYRTGVQKEGEGVREDVAREKSKG